MASRSLNKVQLIGNLTRDPELRYTPKGTAVCTFGLATNRTWTTDAGEKKEEAEFHRLVAWNKLAELCAQLLFKGRRIYVEGRLQTRSWTGQDGVAHQVTEIVISDMMILDSKRAAGEEGVTPETKEEAVEAAAAEPTAPEVVLPEETAKTQAVKKGRKKDEEEKVQPKETDVADQPAEDVTAEDIPF